ncbi:hypothetical protein HDU98_000954 [Podochytrium sp. JEL0797]|nr:hypothetical protein HDU98_000954 [Podochytrium sp. JEL0797]
MPAYDWCDTDETLLKYDLYKSSTLDESRTCDLPPFLQFHHRPHPAPLPLLPSRTQTIPPTPPTTFAPPSPPLVHTNLHNIAPRLLAGTNASIQPVSLMPKPGCTSASGAPLPPYKTVICRAYYGKGKCFRPEPDKCKYLNLRGGGWFVHDASEMRLLDVPAPLSDDTLASPSTTTAAATIAQLQKFHVQRQLQQNQNQQAPTSSKPGSGKKFALSTAPAVAAAAAPVDPRLYKTEMCRFYETSGGVCRFGSGCSFAHGVHELRRRRDDRDEKKEYGPRTQHEEQDAGVSKFSRFWGE